MEKFVSTSSSSDFAVLSLFSALILCFLTLYVLRSPSLRKFKLHQNSSKRNSCNCVCSCNLRAATATVTAPYINGGDCTGNGGGEVLERALANVVVAAERQTGASMMEQLVPEITTHALSYLDFPSLCRLSMTNSSMRKAANDDNAWKALYHKVCLFLTFHFEA